MSKQKHKSHEFDDEADDEYWLEDEPPFDEFDILEWCGERNAKKGRALQATGAITMRSFDGARVRGTLQKGASQIPLLWDLTDESTVCSDVNHARETNPYCEHIAALLYTFLDEPESFVPHNMGEALTLLQQNPEMLAGMGLSQQQLAAAVETLKSAPPEVRASFENLPFDAAPEQLAAVIGAPPPEDELRPLLQALSMEQLRAIAQRRGWVLGTLTKDKLVEQLIPRLIETPLPAEFSPEEEQFLQIENTLYGLADSPAAFSLNALWKKRGGGDMARLDRALRGLSSAGVLFPCTQENKGPHYHWSPMLESQELPLLHLPAKLYPAEKAGRLAPAEPALPILLVADAILASAEHEPLRVQRKDRDPRFANLVGEWDYDPSEVEQLAKNRFYASASGAMSIPFRFFWTDDTLHELATFAGGSRDLGVLTAGLLTALGILKPTDEGVAGVDPQAVDRWRVTSPEERLRVLWDTWQTGAIGYYELRMATERASLVVQRWLQDKTFTPLELVEEMSLARQFVARLLTGLTPSTWYSWKSFAESVRNLRADFLHTFTDEQTWFFAAAKTRHQYQSHNTAHWDAAYRPVLMTMLEGALRWFGAVEPIYDGKELAAFQLTALGAWLLSEGRAGSYPGQETGESEGEVVRWLDDSTLRLRATAAASRVMPLARAFAEPAREPLTFRITDASLTRALERGLSVTDLAAQFADIGAPLPPALRERLTALEANYGRVHLYERLTVLELADELALRELMAGTSLGKHIVHQFSPRLVVVRADAVDELVAELVKKGYTPRVVENGQETDGE